jgi:glycosyltransferase involved in cell wall biosynthesis
MKFSIIIPSFNQAAYIEETILNAFRIKEKANLNKIEVEILLFDSESNAEVQAHLQKHNDKLDFLEIKKDKGQFDAINKGIQRCSGDYWTWLNTDDTLDVDGFFKMVEVLKTDNEIDYIYGGIDYIDENGQFIRRFKPVMINFKTLITKVPGIFQQGSFFKKNFTNKIGFLESYNCCFDYEYVLRCLKNKAKMHVCNFKVANFRQHNISKTGSLTPVFIKEQLIISEKYGRKFWHFLTYFSYLRLIKHALFPRK